MSGSISSTMEPSEFVFPNFNQTRNNPGSESSSAASSTTSTPSQTPMTELPESLSMIAAPPASPNQSRGRPRYKRRQPSRRYYTPPSRVPSPIRPDFGLEVESAPQDPDIFADAETDYFSSTEKADGPRAFRRHFFDAMPNMDGQLAGSGVDSQLATAHSINAILSAGTVKR